MLCDKVQKGARYQLMLIGLLPLSRQRAAEQTDPSGLRLRRRMDSDLFHGQGQQIQAVQIPPHMTGDGFRRDLYLFQVR